MKHAGDFHVDVANGTARAIAAVAGDGKLLRLPIRETGKFSLGGGYNFDDTVSLQHLDGHCLAANSDGGLSLASCDAKDMTPRARSSLRSSFLMRVPLPSSRRTDATSL
ncbi:unnamed protein product [Prorocentrum cordatum]|uniref:Altered inheritance of mitochondria protein 24, mitochondrial n=1 Tax=Prorocentrum cordatum TaxID=2364126 RepID=A0ABN9UWN8_9DINO|nr:unnamed protein product [Polarella glacialis]